jgi:hypothetical protein
MKSSLKTLRQIAEGWANLAADRNKELALSRLEICDSCPSKVQMSPVGTILITALNSEASVYHCGECGCPLEALSRVQDGECKLGKWPSNSFY